MMYHSHSFVAVLLIVQILLGSISGVHGEDRKYGKIAFLFMTRGPMPLEDVWQAFFEWNADPLDYSIYVHTAPGYKYANDSIFHDKNKNMDVKVDWGKMSQVLGIKRLVREALKDPRNERFCLMSESCIPLVSFPKWQSVMFNHSKSIINACPMEGMEEYRWHKDLDQTAIKVKDWRKSATWFTLNRKHAEVFVNETETERHWEGVMCVDEHYLPTILAHKGLENETTCSDGFAYVHWPSNSASHPTTFSGSDISKKFLASLERPIDTQSAIHFSQICSGYEELCHFTARKFSPSSKVPLLMHLKQLFSYEDHPYDSYPWTRYIQKFRRTLNSEGTETLYIVDNGQIRAMPDQATTHSVLHMVRFHDSNIHEIPLLSEADRESNSLGNPFPTRRERTIYKVGRNPELWYMKNGHRRSIPDMDTFFALNCSMGNIRQIAQADIDLIPVGAPLPKIAG